MMLLTPWTLFWLLLVGGAIVLALSRFGARFVDETAVVIGGLASLFWLFLRSRLPWGADRISWEGVAALPHLSWRVDEVAWQLTAWLLALVLGGLLVRVSLKYTSAGSRTAELNGVDWPVGALALWLALAGMVVFWADSLAAVMVGWMGLVPVWGLALLVSGVRTEGEARRAVGGMVWLMVSQAFLWLAAAHLPAGVEQNLIMSDWPTVATSSVLTAALFQMGVWPLYAWRLMERRFTPLLAALVHLVPALAGSSLLGRLVASSNISTGYSLYLTAFSLLGVLLALQRAWGHLHAPARMVAILALAQTSLVLLAAVWAGVEAMMAEARVMVLAVGVLFLAVRESSERFGWGRTVAAGLAVAAAAGLPLTAGFWGRAALYDAWIDQGRWLLLLVTSLMHWPLITVVLVRCWPRRLRNGIEVVVPPLALRALLAVGLALPAVGLLTFPQVVPRAVGFGVWPAVLLPAALSLVAFAYLGDLRQTRQAVVAAFSPNWTFVEEARQWVRTLAAYAGSAVRQAAAILEGEGGMLWLLFFVVLFLLLG